MPFLTLGTGSLLDKGRVFLITACFMLMLLSPVDNDTAIAFNRPSVNCDLVSLLVALCSWFIAFKGIRGKQGQNSLFFQVSDCSGKRAKHFGD